MRIEKDLQSAIRAAAMGQSNRSWEDKNAAIQSAIRDLLRRKPAIATKLKREVKLAAQTYKQYEKHRNAADAFGFNDKLNRIEDRGLFIKVGGNYPKDETWTANQVIAELIVAQPKDLHRILAKYGINWK